MKCDQVGGAHFVNNTGNLCAETDLGLDCDTPSGVVYVLVIPWH